jgi:hypothetical protein
MNLKQLIHIKKFVAKLLIPKPESLPSSSSNKTDSVGKTQRIRASIFAVEKQ